jgi:aminoglycoside 6'-N-acetyltransferase I
MFPWEIAKLDAFDEKGRLGAARLLVQEFRQFWPNAWPTMESAEDEVAQALAPERLLFAARRRGGAAVLGWIGGLPSYNGNVWELHPIVVNRRFQGMGLGRALVARLESGISARGGRTLWVGTDDESNLTTLGGVELYPDLLGKWAGVQNLGGHPFTFSQKIGFELAGVVPDANGTGKPDILMAKPVGPRD